MANKTRRGGKVSLAVLGQQIVDELAASTKPPPEGAFTVYDVAEKFNGFSRDRISCMLNNDKRLASRVYRGKRYYWPKYF